MLFSGTMHGLDGELRGSDYPPREASGEGAGFVDEEFCRLGVSVDDDLGLSEDVGRPSLQRIQDGEKFPLVDAVIHLSVG